MGGLHDSRLTEDALTRLNSEVGGIDYETFCEGQIRQEQTRQWEQASCHFKQSTAHRSKHLDTPQGEAHGESIARIHSQLKPDPSVLLERTEGSASKSSGYLTTDPALEADDASMTDEFLTGDSHELEPSLRPYTYRRANGRAPTGLERYRLEGSMNEGSIKGRMLAREQGVSEASFEYADQRVRLATDNAASLAVQFPPGPTNRVRVMRPVRVKRHRQDSESGGHKRTRAE